MRIIEVVASTRMSNVVRFRSFLHGPDDPLWVGRPPRTLKAEAGFLEQFHLLFVDAD
jgi:hypothetical protein